MDYGLWVMGYGLWVMVSPGGEDVSSEQLD